MITQNHDDDMQQGEQSVSSVVEKQTPTSSEGQSKQAPPSLPRWRAVLFSIFGIVIPLVGGSTVIWLPPILLQIWPQLVPGEERVLPFLAILGMVMGVSVVVGVILLYFAFRARWTCLLAPVAWLAGEFLSDAISRFAQWWPWPPSGGPFWESQSVIIGVMFIPLLIFMGIGIAITIPIDALVRRRTARR